MPSKPETLRRLARLAGAMLLAGLWVGAGQLALTTARAASLTVDSNADTQANDGGCTLREAILNANFDDQSGSTDCPPGSGADTIDFGLAIPTTITLTGNLPDVTGTLTITSPGSVQLLSTESNPYLRPQLRNTGNLTVHGLTSTGVLWANSDGTMAIADSTIISGGVSNASLNTLFISASTVLSGSVLNSGYAVIDTTHFEYGVLFNGYLGNATLRQSVMKPGGLLNSAGVLTVTNSLIAGDGVLEVNAGLGNGLRNEGGGRVVVIETTFSGHTSGYGGAIFNDGGHLELISSTIRDNTATVNGGGIYSSGFFTVSNSLIADNATAGAGGGLLISGYLPLITLTNSTVSGNSAGGNGGGIFSTAQNFTITNSTIANNTAGLGGNIFLYSDTVAISITLRNTLIAGSLAGSDCVNAGAAIIDGGGNFVGDGSCGFPAGGDPRLGPLADNGGPTLTHALLPGSPAINAANPAFCPAVDQRGVVRPQGPGCDIGAFEAVLEWLFFPVIGR